MGPAVCLFCQFCNINMILQCSHMTFHHMKVQFISTTPTRCLKFFCYWVRVKNNVTLGKAQYCPPEVCSHGWLWVVWPTDQNASFLAEMHRYGNLSLGPWSSPLRATCGLTADSFLPLPHHMTHRSCSEHLNHYLEIKYVQSEKKKKIKNISHIFSWKCRHI